MITAIPPTASPAWKVGTSCLLLQHFPLSIIPSVQHAMVSTATSTPSNSSQTTDSTIIARKMKCLRGRRLGTTFLLEEDITTTTQLPNDRNKFSQNGPGTTFDFM